MTVLSLVTRQSAAVALSKPFYSTNACIGLVSAFVTGSRQLSTNPHTLQNTSSLQDQSSSASSVHDKLESIVSSFRAPVRFALAYGSGVFQQKGYDAIHSSLDSVNENKASSFNEKPMVDFIFGVVHSEHWHSLNIKQNPHHYSSIAGLGSGSIAKIQDSFGAGLFYNPDVVVEGARIKYGVVRLDRLINDLNEWDTMYIAGRMHKPTMILRDDARVRLASQTNLLNAVRISLLMLPHQFTEEDLFLKIAGLSYQGDFRMKFGENPYKIYNIVYTQMDAFRDKYKPIIEEIPNVNYLFDGTLQQEDNIVMCGSMIRQLPKKLYSIIKYHHLWYLSRSGKLNTDMTEPALSQSIVQSPELTLYVEKALADVVAIPALTQSIKGVLTAGVSRSIKYAGEKIGKMMSGKEPTKIH
ncbi:hypothetical protein BATDEDRAFT_92831 [Batrachochytrium dendrobatidis JAM81]|uniref:Phosphatidate cytidylyltransferase, mitochondrial n=2 Tax=Batrachochytrium dendrobatidis TaxID=109871 RepID=F4PEP7_BATDJ|nr:uncharacterized protein BATDEDRAFT_92831 [Batrachochytrium dendrobatidis JAM81]EGF76334.1 hypothetical protein BATDEDRAFT_92831 [Batrachochytrium dendrobatidis JAM81]OAJ42999.1 hypothetical protein BDEG_26384 [Batrachochytrium dendrobatidis JEL423]|eukprot:XP_006683121.1 hypothetical protein BATDEDRAFT_92831 [Batrachochytrium dendrobatidis JAM81]